MKDNVGKKLIRISRKETRKRLLKLPNFWCSISILLIAIILLLTSLFLFNCCPWLSNALISTSCGCFTGLVLYFLANIRNNKVAKLQTEYHALKETLRIMRVITGYGLLYSMTRFWGKRNTVEDSGEIWRLLQELDEARNEVPNELYDTVPNKGYDPVSHDNLDSYKELLMASEYETFKNNIIYISEEIDAVITHLDILFREREDQLRIMGKSYF